jgi:hypothetical protein
MQSNKFHADARKEAEADWTGLGSGVTRPQSSHCAVEDHIRGTDSRMLATKTNDSAKMFGIRSGQWTIGTGCLGLDAVVLATTLAMYVRDMSDSFCHWYLHLES